MKADRNRIIRCWKGAGGELAGERCVQIEETDLPGVISDRLKMQEGRPDFRLRVFPLGQGQVLVTAHQHFHVNEVFRSVQHPVS